MKLFIGVAKFVFGLIIFFLGIIEILLVDKFSGLMLFVFSVSSFITILTGIHLFLCGANDIRKIIKKKNRGTY